jgi:hypothetical protein
LPDAVDTSGATWDAAQQELAAARQALATAPAGIARQLPYSRQLAAERRCTRLVHGWFATALDLAPVIEPRIVFSVDVDGVLEDDDEGFSSTGISGAAALRLLQLGRVAVLLNTARSGLDVRDRIGQLGLLGGVAAFGAVLCNGIFGGELNLLSATGTAQLDVLRTALRADAGLVLDSTYRQSLRVSRIIGGQPHPIAGADARQLLDQSGLDALTFWVAPRHTDFVDRSVDKGIGIARLRPELGLAGLPLAAIGDGACDLAMLRLASIAFAPAGAAPGYTPPRRQRFARCRSLGDRALWEAACQLVPDVALQHRVLSTIESLRIPTWLPPTRTQRRPASTGLLLRVAGALSFVRNS